MRILTWNIGSFSFLKYAKYFGISYNKQKILHEYFQSNINGNFVSKSLEKFNPDIIFLQEFYHPKDVDSIKILSSYPYKKLIHTWYHKHSILIASKYEFSLSEQDNFQIVSVSNLNIIPIHLNSFSAKKRLDDCVTLKGISRELSNVIILGDSNIWSRGKIFLFKNDKKAYSVITESLSDFSKDIVSTSYLGFGLDKVFGSKGLLVNKIQSPKIRGDFMDHYPIILDIKNNT